MIEKGNYYLIGACKEGEISKYHLEAGIAYWHTTPTDHDKWRHVLKLYDQLLTWDSSPMIALNRLFAFAKVHGHKKALAEARKNCCLQNSYYYELLGYLHGEEDIENAVYNYRKALGLIKSNTRKNILLKEITRLSQMLNS